LGAYELRKAGQAIKLGRIPMELLLLLVEQHGQLVTRDQIVEKIWGKEVFLDTDNSINAAIRKIRQVLEDNADVPVFIQTIIGRGYRFIAPVEIVKTEETTAAAHSVAASRIPVALWSVAGLLLLVVVLVGFTFAGLRNRLFRNQASISSPVVLV